MTVLGRLQPDTSQPIISGTMNTQLLQNAKAATDAKRTSRVLVSAAGVVGFALLTALGAQLVIPLPGTPVPITLQTFFVLLAGITLGPRLGTASMAFYLLLGTAGYHIFASGNWGLATVLGATGGYLIGFVLAQPFLGQLARPGDHHWSNILGAILAGNAVIFGCGLIWLAIWAQSGVAETLTMGFWPHVPGLILKSALAFGVGGLTMPAARKLFRS